MTGVNVTALLLLLFGAVSANSVDQETIYFDLVRVSIQDERHIQAESMLGTSTKIRLLCKRDASVLEWTAGWTGWVQFNWVATCHRPQQRQIEFNYPWITILPFYWISVVDPDPAPRTNFNVARPEMTIYRMPENTCAAVIAWWLMFDRYQPQRIVISNIICETLLYYMHSAYHY